jgi:mono/diheme cytochrome c family protein
MVDMRFFLAGISSWALFVLGGCECMDQYRTAPKQWEKLREERELAHRVLPKLTEEGKIPVVDKAAGSPAAVAEEKYQALCASCHGANGDGQTPMAAALKPSPRNFTDAGWQGKVDDAHIAKIIKSGGAAVGLSPMMAPWGGVLTDEEIQQIVKKIRGFKK